MGRRVTVRREGGAQELFVLKEYDEDHDVFRMRGKDHNEMHSLRHLDFGVNDGGKPHICWTPL